MKFHELTAKAWLRQQLVTMLLIVAFLTIVVWAPFRFFGDVTLKEFLSSHWYLPVGWFFFLILALIGLRKRTAETWNVIKTDYSGPAPALELIDECVFSGGLLCYEDERIAVTILVSEFGVLLSPGDDDNAFIAWRKLQSIIKVGTIEDRVATLALRRQTAMPFNVSVPWVREFDKYVPTEIMVVA